MSALTSWVRQSGIHLTRLAVIMGLVAVHGLLAQTPADPALLLVALTDGRVLAANALEGDGQKGFVVRHGGGQTQVAAAELLAVHGNAVLEAGLPAAWLAGTDVVRGALVGGDHAGERLELQSPVLDKVQIPVDRLLALTATGGPRPEALQLPEGVDEALYARARLGFDRIVGAVHEFGPRGVRFLPAGEKEPRWFPLADLVGLRIADPQPRAEVAPAELWTRTGDRLGVTLRRATAEHLECTLEGGREVQLRWRDVACLCVRGVATFVSDLEPSSVSETGFDGEVLYPWQRDRGASGGPLVAGGRTYGKGLGVHSRSRLTYTVPPGAATFWSRVAIDDTAAALVVRADVDVRVLVDGKVAFAKKGLGPGGAPLDTGAIAVKPGQALVLEVDFGNGRELGDRVAWLLPVFLPSAAKKP